MSLSDRINERNTRSRHVPLIMLKLLLLWLASAIVLALLVPSLNARGMELKGWMIWTVILVTVLLSAIPVLYGRRRRRP